MPPLRFTQARAPRWNMQLVVRALRCRPGEMYFAISELPLWPPCTVARPHTTGVHLIVVRGCKSCKGFCEETSRTSLPGNKCPQQNFVLARIAVGRALPYLITTIMFPLLFFPASSSSLLGCDVWSQVNGQSQNTSRSRQHWQVHGSPVSPNTSTRQAPHNISLNASLDISLCSRNINCFKWISA